MKKLIFTLLAVFALLSIQAQTINYLQNDSNQTVIKITAEGLAPRVRIYQNESALLTPDQFTKVISKGYPAPVELIELLSTPESFEEYNSIYGLTIERTYKALLLWIEKNPDADLDFGILEDWTIIYTK